MVGDLTARFDVKLLQPSGNEGVLQAGLVDDRLTSVQPFQDFSKTTILHRIMHAAVDSPGVVSKRFLQSLAPIDEILSRKLTGLGPEAARIIHLFRWRKDRYRRRILSRHRRSFLQGHVAIPDC